MDPQQRIFLEESWKALEDAGYANEDISGCRCGVFVGAAPRDYLNLISEKVDITAQAFWGNTGSILASRISYFLNLKGPAITIDTACSSSLVSIHLACQSIKNGECEMAIAGGIWICTTPHYYIFTSNAGMLSPDGVCKTFDNGADGIVNGEGVGCLILKKLSQAIKDGDSIYGLIKGSCMNQDGKTNGITAPSSLSQSNLELEVYNKYHINPETISFVETHGTGTKLGDPIEVDALKRSFNKFTDKRQFCALGSVKTNIGHASLAAGIASVIKVVLALKNKKIPPSLNFTMENEQLDLKNSPFYVNTELQDLKSDGERLRAAISSFGFSGTNVHMVIEEYKDNDYHPNPDDSQCYLIPFSGRSETELLCRLREFMKWSENNKERVCDIAYSLGRCRKHFDYRIAFVISNQEELNLEISNVLKKIHQKDSGENIVSETSCNTEKYENVAQMLGQLKNQYELGKDIDWKGLYNDQVLKRLHLPVYPLRKESYWIKTGTKSNTNNLLESPFIHGNISNLKSIKYLTEIRNIVEKLGKCKGKGRIYFPWSSFIELFLEIGKVASGKNVLCIKDMLCASPEVYSEDKTKFFTEIYRWNNEYYLETNDSQDSTMIVYAQGKILFEKPVNDIVTLFDKKVLEEECSHLISIEKRKIRLVDTFHIICEKEIGHIQKMAISLNGEMALLHLNINDESIPKYVINPLLLEEIFKTALLITPKEDKKYYYFSGLHELIINNRIKNDCTIYIKRVNYIKHNNNVVVWLYDVLIVDIYDATVLSINGYKITAY